MTTTELIHQKSICVYAVIYIKHVRQHGYSKSFYSFMQKWHPSAKDKRAAQKFDHYLRDSKLIIRKGRQHYEWNHDSRIILMSEIVEVLNKF